MKKKFAPNNYLLNYIVAFAIDAIVIYAICLHFTTSGNAELNAVITWLAYRFFNFALGYYLRLRHAACYYILGKRKKETEQLKNYFQGYNIPAATLKTHQVDDYLIQISETQPVNENKDAVSFLTSQWFMNQILELGCPAMESWVHRDMIRRALAPQKDAK